MKPYKPSQVVPIFGLLWLTLLSVFGGAIIGIFTSLISPFIYLFILFPLLMGLAGGGLNMMAVKQGKIRNPLVSAFFGALTGFIIYNSLHIGEYSNFKQEFREAITQKHGILNEYQIDKLLDEYLQKETGYPGFVGYMEYKAKQGISIGEVVGSRIPLNKTFTQLYWLMELVIIEAIIIYGSYMNCHEPFCENCKKWYGKKEHIGNVGNQSAEKFLQLINQNNFPGSGKLIKSTIEINYPRLEVHLQCCPKCKDTDLMLTVNKASLDSNGNLHINETQKGMISRRQEAQMRRNIIE